MKKHAYLILAHNNPWQLSILMEMLDDSRNDIFLLIDAKSSLEFSDISYSPSKSKVFHFKNQAIYWGSISLIHAELFLVEQALEKGQYSYLHLISGLDFPLKTQDFIHHFFNQQTKEFIAFNPLNIPIAQWKTERFHFFVQGFNYPGNPFYKYARNGLFLAQKILGIKRKREFPNYFHGSAWFSITFEFGRYLLSRKSAILKTYRHTICCDEVFLQTELMYSPFESYIDPELDQDTGNLRLIDWSRRQGNSPYTWQLSDLPVLIHSKALFARKIDERVDKELILALKDHLLANHESKK